MVLSLNDEKLRDFFCFKIKLYHIYFILIRDSKKTYTNVEAESKEAYSARIISEPKPQTHFITDDQVIIRNRIERLKRDWRGSNTGLAFILQNEFHLNSIEVEDQIFDYFITNHKKPNNKDTKARANKLACSIIPCSDEKHIYGFNIIPNDEKWIINRHLNNFFTFVASLPVHQQNEDFIKQHVVTETTVNGKVCYSFKGKLFHPDAIRSIELRCSYFRCSLVEDRDVLSSVTANRLNYHLKYRVKMTQQELADLFSSNPQWKTDYNKKKNFIHRVMKQIGFEYNAKKKTFSRVKGAREVTNIIAAKKNERNLNKRISPRQLCYTASQAEADKMRAFDEMNAISSNENAKVMLHPSSQAAKNDSLTKLKALFDAPASKKDTLTESNRWLDELRYNAELANKKNSGSSGSIVPSSTRRSVVNAFNKSRKK